MKKTPKQQAARYKPALSRPRGRPPKQQFPFALGLASTSVQHAEIVRQSVATALDHHPKFSDRLSEASRKVLIEALVHELNHLRAAQDSRAKAKRSRRGRKPQWPFQLFLGALEAHFQRAGIKLTAWEWGDREALDALRFASEILRTVEIRVEASSLRRQWQQREFRG